MTHSLITPVGKVLIQGQNIWRCILSIDRFTCARSRTQGTDGASRCTQEAQKLTYVVGNTGFTIRASHR